MRVGKEQYLAHFDDCFVRLSVCGSIGGLDGVRRGPHMKETRFFEHHQIKSVQITGSMVFGAQNKLPVHTPNAYAHVGGGLSGQCIFAFVYLSNIVGDDDDDDAADEKQKYYL